MAKRAVFDLPVNLGCWLGWWGDWADRIKGLTRWRRFGRTCFEFLKSLKFLTRLESNCFTRWNINLLAGSRVTSNAGFAGLDVENAKAAEFDTFAAPEGVLHRFEDGFDGMLGLGSGDIGLGYHGIYDIELDHNR